MEEFKLIIHKYKARVRRKLTCQNTGKEERG
jgi:hypothetical protein